MNWLIMLLQLLTALPDILKLIKEIIELFKNVPKDQRKDAERSLRQIISDARKDRFLGEEHAKKLRTFVEYLRGFKKS